MEKIFTCVLLLACLVLTACQDVVTRVYSTKYPVRACFTLVSYAELQGVVNNSGQFGTVRQVGDQIWMTSPSSSNPYPLNSNSKTFTYGLGGLIVGTTNSLHLRAYDLACPNCDVSYVRLTLTDNGYARCPSCAMVYNLNDDGSIYDTGKGLYKKPRGLYRYGIEFDGTTIVLSNVPSSNMDNDL